MGNVKSFCCRDNISEANDREERSRILNDNNATSADDLYDPTTTGISHHDTTSYGSLNNVNRGKTLEQSALDQIYQKMAANLIDVAPGDSIVMQHAEYLERQKTYQAKLNQIKAPLPLRSANRIFKQGSLGSSPGDSFNVSTLSKNIQSNHFSPNVNSSHVNKNSEKYRVEYEPISQENVQLISEISLRSSIAIESLKITYPDQVVTQFKS